MASVAVLFLMSSIFPSQSEICSLYNTHSAILKSLTFRDIYEFYSSVELSDIQMSFCNSVNKADFFTQLCAESKSLFKNERDELNSKQQWLQINLNTLRSENRTNDRALHVLQWRHGCAVEHHSNGSIIFLQGTDEHAYDGKNLTFDLSMHWNESVSGLERRCVETLTSFIDLQRKRKFTMASRPEVYASVKASESSEQQVLVCLATGFYPKYVEMEIRRDQTPLPDAQLNSSGIRPNADGSFQLIKSLKILSHERSHYQCVVKHQTLTEPLIISWDEVSVLLPVIVGLVVALVVLAIILLVFYLLCVKKYKSQISGSQSISDLKLHSLGERINVPQMRRPMEDDDRPGFISFFETNEFLMRRPMEDVPQMRRPMEDVYSSIQIPRMRRPMEDGPVTHAALAAVLDDSSDEENTTDDSLQDPADYEERHETQSLCEAKETPAAAPPAAQGTMGSKNISLPNFGMEREDTDQNTVTQNTLQLPVPRRCRSKNISMPNLTLERKESED